MPTTFAYRVRDQGGALVEGSIEADNEGLVATKLRSMGYTPVSITQLGSSAFKKELHIPGIGNKVKVKDLAVFFRQLATMISSGLPVLRALSVLEQQTERQRLAEVASSVRAGIERGASLSGAMANHPEVFSRLVISMVRAGETAGVLESVLERLAVTLERQHQLRPRVKSAMTYPVVVGIMVLLILAGMMLFIIPMFKGMYTELGGELPAPTKLLISISNAFRSLWFVWIIGGVGGTFAFRRWKRTEAGRRGWDAFTLRVPIFGVLARKNAIARVGRTFAALTRAGVPILEALEIVGESAGNEVVNDAFVHAQSEVKRGLGIAQPLERHDVIPAMMVQMIAVGEETGQLDAMLDKIADFYEREVEATVDQLTSLIEPLLVAVMGATVGGMVIALYLPMFNIIKLIK